MDQAMRMGRFHCQERRKVLVENNRFTLQGLNLLEQKGYEIEKAPPFYFGAVHAVMKKEHGSGYQGVAECRRDGVAVAVEPITKEITQDNAANPA